MKDIMLIYTVAVLLFYRYLWKKSCKELREIEESRDYWKKAAGHEEIKGNR